MNEFKPDAIKKLKYYVYALVTINNDQEEIFYIGKGKGNRVFSHFKEANKLKELPDKLTNKHNEILKGNAKAYILRHGLTDEESLQYEAVLIDLLNAFGKRKLTNLVKGHVNKFGPKVEILNIDQINATYSNDVDLQSFAEKHKLKITVIKLNLKETYFSLLGKDLSWGIEALWRISEDTITNSDIILGVHKGTIFGVFKYKEGTISALDINSPSSVKQFQERLDWYKDKGLTRRELYDNLMAPNHNNRKYFKVDTINRPSIGSLDVKTIEHPKARLFEKELMNRFIGDEKIKGQSPIMKYWTK